MDERVSAVSGQASALQRAQEDAGEHRAVQAAGIRITERGVVAAEQRDAVGQLVLSGVAKGKGRAAFDDSLPEKVGEVAIPGDLAEADHDADFRQGGELGGEVRGAVANLLRGGLVAGRSAAHYRSYPKPTQFKAVVAADGYGLAGQAEFVEDRVHEVAGAVSREGTAGAVGSMGAWGEAEHEDAGVGVAEAWDGFGPVLLVAIGLAAGFADASNVVDEPRTARAGDDAVLQLIEDGEGGRFGWPLGAHWGLSWGGG